MGIEKGSSGEKGRQAKKITESRLALEAFRSKASGAKANELEEYFKGMYRDQLDKYDRVKDSSFYLYTKQEIPKGKDDETPGTDWETIKYFYHKASPSVKRFYEGEVALKAIGEKLTEKDSISVDELITVSSEITLRGASLTRDLRAFNDAPAEPGKGLGNLNGIQQVVIKKVCKEIGSDKPEEFRESMRRYMPRWMWNPLSPPETEIPPDYQEKFDKLWSGYSTREANFLIYSDNLEQGKAPIHMAFKAATAVEKDGHKDLGYTIRTSAIIDTLAIEKERIQAEEQPFFTYVFGGTMTGESKQPPKNTHFNYQSAINETMRETFSRLSDELREGSEGPATEFIERLSSYYPDQFPELFARSLFTHGHQSEKLDELTILGKVLQRDSHWTSGVIEQADKAPIRRALTTHEVNNFSQYLPEPADQERPPATCIDNIELIAGEELAYNFTDRLRDTQSGRNLSVTVDLDMLSESVTAKVGFNVGGKIRYVPFQVSFSGEKESMQLKTLGTDRVDEPTLDKYRNIVFDVIGNQAEKIRAKKRKATNPTIEAHTERAPLKIRELTREERIKLYEETKARSEKKRKAPQENVIFEKTRLDPKEQHSEQTELTILGLDQSQVSTLLDEERIEVVTPDEIIEKVETMMDMAQINKKMLGKKVRQSQGLNLRQLNWVLEGGRTQIRVYLEDIGSSQFVLRGIHNKKGETQQSKYIDKLVKNLLREKSPESDDQ